MQETSELVKTIYQSANGGDKRIPALYRFGVEVLGWVTIVAQFWVEQQKKKSKKEKRGEWTKAIEPFVAAVLEITTTLSTYALQEPQFKNMQEGELKEIIMQGPLETVKQEVLNSHKQSHSNISGILASRAKVLKSASLAN